MKLDKKQTIGRLQLLIATAFWGASFIFVKALQSDGYAPSTLMAFRFTIGAIILAAIYFKKFKLLDLSYLWRGVVMGFLLYASFMLQTYGLNDTTPGTNAFLTACYCVIVPFLYWLLTKKKPDKWNVIAAFICLIGIGLVSFTNGFRIAPGDAITLTGGVMYAIQIVSTALLIKDRDPILLSVLQIATVAIFSWITTFFIQPELPSVSMEQGLKVLYLAVFCTAMGFTFQNMGQKIVDTTIAGIILSLECVFALIISLFCGQENLTFEIGCGFVLIFVAVIISETKLNFLFKLFKKNNGNDNISDKPNESIEGNDIDKK